MSTDTARVSPPGFWWLTNLAERGTSSSGGIEKSSDDVLRDIVAKYGTENVVVTADPVDNFGVPISGRAVHVRRI